MAATARTLIFTHGTNTTVTGALNLNGSPGVIMSVRSDNTTPATITGNLGVVFLNYINSTYMSFLGTSTWVALNSVDAGNNLGIIFMQNVQMYVVSAWKTAKLVQVQINGVWKVVTKAQIQIGGVWKSVF